MVKLMRSSDKDVSEADRELYRLVLKVGKRYGVDPSVPLEGEDYFVNLLGQYQGDPRNLPSWLNEQIPQHFVAINKRPRWIQNPEWPFANGKPMIFVGQINVSTQQEGKASQMFHDDTSFYVFISVQGPPVVVMQQY